MNDGRYELDELFAAARAVRPPSDAAARGWAGVQAAVAPTVTTAPWVGAAKLAGAIAVLAAIAVPAFGPRSPEPAAPSRVAVTTGVEVDAPAPNHAPAALPTTPTVVVPDAASQPVVAPTPAAAHRTPRAATPAAAPSPTPTAAVDALRDEAELLGRAWVAIREGDAVATRRLLGEHARRFPTGALVPERQACEKVAACLAGEPGAADDAERWLAGQRTSHLADRVAAGCSRRRSDPRSRDEQTPSTAEGTR